MPARIRSCGVAAPETLEQARDLVGRDLTAAVLYSYGRALVSGGAYTNLPGGIRVRHGVVQKIPQDEPQLVAIRPNQRPGREMPVNAQIPGGRRQLKLLPNSAQQRVHVDILKVSLELPRISPGERQEIFDHASQSLRDAKALVDYRLISFRLARSRATDFQSGLQTRERGAQLVSDIGRE